MSTSEPQPISFALWPKLAPGTEHWSHAEQETTVPFGRITFVRNVTHPTLTAYLPDPDIATGAAALELEQMFRTSSPQAAKGYTWGG